MNSHKRDIAVDVTRSLAIVLMVAANMAVISHSEPAWIFRLGASLAAPLFVILASMMVVLGFSYGKGVIASMIKCAFLFVIAGLLDISNTQLPFENIDVLYLIGILLVIVSVAGRLPNIILAILITVILSATPYLQSRFGYSATMVLDITNKNLVFYKSTFFTEAAHRYLIDGWFPLFPWASLGLFGALIGKLRYRGNDIVSFTQHRYVVAALILLFAGAFIWWLFPGDQLVRYDYIELFYPPMPGFMLFTMGIIAIIICWIDYVGDVSLWAVLHPLGEAALFMYLFHIVVIEHVLLPLGIITFGTRYLIYYLILISVMILIGVLLRKIRETSSYQKLPHVVKWVFG